MLSSLIKFSSSKHSMKLNLCVAKVRVMLVTKQWTVVAPHAASGGIKPQ